MFGTQVLKLAVASVFGIGLGCASGGAFTEDFSADPTARGWAAVGETNLFRWDSGNGALEVTWDSSKSNSYYARPLGMVIGKQDDFIFAFDLRLKEFAAGNNPEKPSQFELSVALLNLGQANATNFMRGTGADSPNLVEFSFFPDPGGAWQWGPSITASMIDNTGTNWSYDGFAPLALTVDDLFQVTMEYSSQEQALHTIVRRNGELFVSLSDAKLGPAFTDFQVDHFAIASYSERGQTPAYAGSIFAKGTVDNVSFLVGPRLSTSFKDGKWQASFYSRSNWTYTLERTTDFQTWQPAAPPAEGTGGVLNLGETNAPGSRAFYRIHADPR